MPRTYSYSRAQRQPKSVPGRIRVAPPPSRVAVIGRDGLLAILVSTDTDARVALRAWEAAR